MLLVSTEVLDLVLTPPSGFSTAPVPAPPLVLASATIAGVVEELAEVDEVDDVVDVVDLVDSSSPGRQLAGWADSWLSSCCSSSITCIADSFGTTIVLFVYMNVLLPVLVRRMWSRC